MTDRNADKMPILLQAILWGKWFGSESNYKKMFLMLYSETN